MKKLALFIPLFACTGCQQPLSPARMTVGADSTQMWHVPHIAVAPDSTELKRQLAHVADELQFYLERHNVQDEGYELIASYAAHGDSTATFLPHGDMCIWNVGHWRNMPRRGTTVARDRQGRIIIGTCEADTLAEGIRLDPHGTYAGEFSDGLAHGHGSYFTAADGTYYEGLWQRDRREGFGFAVSPTAHVRAGMWKQDKYLGERISYTTERVYGIDISRYQHGKGRKKFPILWDQLRITHLGTLSKKTVIGAVDYPVDFVFIKATEGTTISNPHFAPDYAQARKHGIPVGAYHFFSTRSDAREQAAHFLRHVQFHRGDLPPVLDVEPTDQAIAQMGGTAALFRAVRTWIALVQARTGVRPILYVNQMFVNKHLAQAPDLKRDHMVWIARYGEYRPDVKLAVWQLAPDGRVAGITGEVDINVFNGYRHQFDEFLESETLKSD